jgi:DNA-binding MarR family transcriptional regulator
VSTLSAGQPVASKQRPPVGAVRFRAMEWIEKIEHLSPPQAAVLLYLAHRVDAQRKCRPGRQRIARGTKLHPNTVTRAIQALEAEALIRVRRGRSRLGHVVYLELELAFVAAVHGAVDAAEPPLQFL